MAEVEEWLISYLAEVLEIEKNEVDITAPFETYGLDSSSAVILTGDLSEQLGYELDPTLLYDYPTIEAVTQYLVDHN